MASMDSEPASTWSFEDIYKRFKAQIYTYIYNLIGDREQADDLTQETFLKAFRALPENYNQVSFNLSAWLYRIATNNAYDALRRRRLITWTPWRELEQEPIDVESLNIYDTIETAELIRDALSHMPPTYRAALLLYTQHGKNYAEIAEMLHIAESGVKMYLSRARQSFRENYRMLEEDRTRQQRGSTRR
jgi:RNA polymerase sigma-70 factor, ECF subfamily